VLDDYRGVSGVALSVPSIVGSAGVTGLIDVPFSVHESEQFERSAETIRETLDDLGID
jgi:L-lactate dehydrogenase